MGVLGITDDILVYGVGDTEDEANADHDRNLKALLERSCERGIVLNKDELTFMGHIFTSDGLKIDHDKIKAVVDMPKPEDVLGLLSCRRADQLPTRVGPSQHRNAVRPDRKRDTGHRLRAREI